MRVETTGPASPGIDPVGFVRPELRELPPYHLDLAPCAHKLDQNEVPWDLPRRLKRSIVEAMMERDWARYPDFHAETLRESIGDVCGWPAAGVLVGNGSNELLGVALQALTPLGGDVLGVEPSFGLYPALVRKSGGSLRGIRGASVAKDMSLPLGELEREIERDPTRPVLLCTPNNPTGAAATPHEVERLLARLRAPLLLDNAYGEFCAHDYLPLLHAHPHLVIFRTFSKAWSLAGLRLGYLLAAPRMVDQLLKIKLPYNLGHASAIAGAQVLAAADVAARRIRVLRGRRSQWASMLAEAGLEVFPSQANFILVRSRASRPAAEAKRLREGLEARGIRVRDVGGYAGLAGCLRVSVGNGGSLRAVRRALSEIGRETV